MITTLTNSDTGTPSLVDINEMKDLPNQVGFKFIGIDKDGAEHFCIVRRKQVGRKTVYVINSNTVEYKSLRGWKRHD